MTETFSIREIQPSDLVALAQLNHEFNDVAMTPEQVADRFRSTQSTEIVVVAEMGDRIVGFACVQICDSVCYTQPWAELTELYVCDSYRRQGIGRGLIQESERLTRQKGAKKMVLRTGTTNATGQAFYKALGFTSRPHLTLQKSLSEPASQ
jgi:GNAT superfamily N-acetyltransferase